MKKRMKILLSVLLVIALNASLVVASSAEISELAGSILGKISALTVGEESLWDGSASTAPTYSGGVYVIDSAAKLRGFADAITNGTTYYGYTVKLTVDINLNGKTWTGAAASRGDYSNGAYAFRGTFDGDGHYISNYTNTDFGFFRYLLSATIKNVTFKNVNKSSTTNGNRYAGGIVSSSRGTTVFDNVDIQSSYFNFTYSDSSGSRHSQNGAVVGIIDEGSVTFRNCDYSDLTGYSQDARSGMLVGNAVSNTNLYIYDCSFSNAYFYQNSSRCADLGLVVGFCEGNLYVDGLTVGNNTRINSRKGAGGIVGNITSGHTLSVKNVTMDGFTITGQNDESIGAICGYAGGSLIIDGFTATNLTVTGATNQSAGLIGYSGSTASVSNVNITSLNVTSTSNDVAGIIGKTMGNVTMNNITIDGAALKNNGACLGTLVGYNGSSTNCTFTGITLKGNISLTNTGGDGTGGLFGNYSGGNSLYFYDIVTKDANITRSVSNKSNQGQIVGYCNGSVVIGTKNLAMNELSAINIPEGGNRVGGLFGYIEGKPLTLSNTRINGSITAYAANGTSTYDLAGAIAADVDGLCTLNNVIITGNINVKGDEHIGGLLGYAGNTFAFNNVQIGGNINVITTYQNVGGLVGKYNSGNLSTISGMNLNNINITATSSGCDVGGLVGWTTGAITIQDTTIASVTISTLNTDIGGLIGGTSGNDINISGVNIGSVNLSNATSGYIGGFIGKTVSNTTITDSSIGSGSITGPKILGGAIGYFSGSGKTLKIENYDNAINITTNVTSTGDTDGFIGGVVGNIDNGTSASITGCSNSGTLKNTVTTAKTKYYGGILGRSTITTTIANCYNTGLINGPSCNGGIVGYSQGVVNIKYCYNTGDIKATSSNATSNGYYAAAGIACWVTSASTIEYCFNRGNISSYSTATYHAGGIVGFLNNSNAKVQYCYSTGTVTTPNSTYYRGYIAGRIGSGTVQYCYTTNSGLLVGTGTASNSSYIAPNNLKGSNYVSNTQLGTVYFTTDDASINDKYPILYWMGDPFEKNEDGIWEIWNTGHYNQFLNKVNTGTTFAGETVRLMDDVDLSTLETFTTIGGNGGTTYSFQGTFEGNNHSFSNFTLNNGTTTYTGFFGYIKNATIKDLTLDNFNITGGQYTGGLVGYSDGTSSLSNIKVKNGIVVTGGKYTGGLVGYSNSTMTLSGFSATGILDVNCGTQSGGILGYTNSNIVFTDIALESVDVDSTSEYIGGLIGVADGTTASSISSITVTGKIDVFTTSGSYVGGIASRVDGNFTVGTSSKKSIINGISVVTNNGSNVGGIVGNHTDSSASNTITNIEFGDITAKSTGNYTAGLVGYSTSYVQANSIKMGNVTISAGGGSSCGAIVGWTKNTATLSGSNNSIGDIVITSTGKYLAGVFGEVDSSAYVYNLTTGDITINGGSSTDIGGYCGNVTGSIIISNCTSNDISLYGTGNTRGGLVGYGDSSAFVTGTTIKNVVIGTTEAKASQYSAGFFAFVIGNTSIYNSDITTVTIYSSNSYSGGFIGRTSSTATVSGSDIGTVTLTSGENGAGFIGYCIGATISDSTLNNCVLTVSGQCKGGFVGNVDSSGNLTFAGENALNTLLINYTNNNYVGTFAGRVTGKLTIDGQKTTVPKSFTYYGTSDNSIEQVGAIAGSVGSADISGLSFDVINIGTSTLRAKYIIGGFIGNVGGDLSLSDCNVKSLNVYTGSNYSSGSLFSSSSSDSKTGGLVGNISGNLIADNITVNALTLTAEGESVGGLFGVVGGSAKISNIQLLGDTSSISNKMFNVGGIIGFAGSTVVATNCVNHADINYLESKAKNKDSIARIGGIVGHQNSGISAYTDCTNYGDITLVDNFKYTGGIVGNASGNTTFTNCENSGNIISGGSYVSGIVGNIDGDLTAKSCKNIANKISGIQRISGIVGQASSKVDLDDCYNTAAITSTDVYAGGIVGSCDSANAASTADNCYNTGKITGAVNYTGGLFGTARLSATGCYNTGVVSGVSHTGGLAGYMDSSYTVTDCYNEGAVSGSLNVGGIIGFADSDAIKVYSCYNKGNVTNTGSATGGIIGATKSSTGTIVSKCYNEGTVTGITNVGGIAGISFAAISESFNIGNIKTTSSVTESYVGGVVGIVGAGSSVKYCYNIGDINIAVNSGKVGGVVGTLAGTMSDCYNAGEIVGYNSTSGAVIGYLYNTAAGAVTSAYGISGRACGTVSGSNNTVSIVEAEVLQKMTETSLNTTYFSPINYFNKGFPVLKWYLDGNDHSVLDADFVTALTCNSNDEIDEIYSNYAAIITPVIQQITDHGKYQTAAEIAAADKLITDALAELVEISANYNNLDIALAKVPEKLYYYTEITYTALQDAVDAVERGLGVTKQAEVDDMTKAILDAIDGLELIQYTVTVSGDSAVTYSEREGVPYRIAKVTTPSTNASGQTFSYWVEETASGDLIVSTYRNYSFYLCKDVTLKPVYGVDRTPAIIASRVMDVRDNGDGTSAILVEHSASSSVSILLHGVLFTTDGSSAGDLNVDSTSESINNAVASTTKNTLTGLFEVEIENKDASIYARSYVMDADGVVHYGDVVEFDTSSSSQGASVSSGIMDLQEFSLNLYGDIEDAETNAPVEPEVPDESDNKNNSVRNNFLMLLLKLILLIFNISI